MTSGSSQQVLNAILLKISQLLGVVAHSENPSTWEAEAGELLATSWRPAGAIQQNLVRKQTKQIPNNRINTRNVQLLFFLNYRRNINLEVTARNSNHPYYYSLSNDKHEDLSCFSICLCCSFVCFNTTYIYTSTNPHMHICLTTKNLVLEGAGQMAQQLGELDALPKDLGQITSTHMAAHNRL